MKIREKLAKMEIPAYRGRLPRRQLWKCIGRNPASAKTQSEMNLQFTKDGKLRSLETVPWDDDLNAGLIQLQVRAVTPEQEAERFALGLLRGIPEGCRESSGDGYFNAVHYGTTQRTAGSSRIRKSLKFSNTLMPIVRTKREHCF